LGLVEKVKKISNQIKVIIGGPFATCYPEYFIRKTKVDAISLGESEFIITELIEALDDQKKLRNVKGIIFKDNGKIVRTEQRPLIKNLDDIPIPAYHLLPMKKYFNYQALRRPSAGLITTRGCPFNCAYCEVP